MWYQDIDKVKRDSLLFEYHNARQIVVNSNKDIISEQQQADSTRLETEAGDSSSSRRSPEEIDNARRTLEGPRKEEQQAISAGDKDAESPNEDAGEPEPQQNSDEDPPPIQVPRILNRNESTNKQSPLMFGSINPARIIDVYRDVNADTTEGFDPLDDRNVTRRTRRYNTIDLQDLGGISNTGNNNAGNISQDVRRSAPEIGGNHTGKINELVLLMASGLEKITTNNYHPKTINQQSPGGSGSNWHDPKDVRRKACKSISSQFTRKTFSGKFGENWDRH